MAVVWAVLSFAGCAVLGGLAQAVADDVWQAVFRSRAEAARVVGSWALVVALAASGSVFVVVGDPGLGWLLVGIAVAMSVCAVLTTRHYRREHMRPRAHDPRRTAPDPVSTRTPDRARD